MRARLFIWAKETPYDLDPGHNSSVVGSGAGYGDSLKESEAVQWIEICGAKNGGAGLAEKSSMRLVSPGYGVRHVGFCNRRKWHENYNEMA